MKIELSKEEVSKIVSSHISSMFPNKVVRGTSKYDGEYEFDITDSEEKKAE